MAAPRLHVNEILDKLITLLDTNLSPAPPTGLGLKSINKGDLEFYVGPSTPVQLTAELPAIFLKPSPATEIEIVAMGQEYQVRYRHRLVYVKNFSTTEKVVEERIKETVKLVELLIDNYLLPGLTLTNGQVIGSVPRSVEWEPAEDEFVATLNLDIIAVAITYDVMTRTKK